LFQALGRPPAVPPAIGCSTKVQNPPHVPAYIYSGRNTLLALRAFRLPLLRIGCPNSTDTAGQVRDTLFALAVDPLSHDGRGPVSVPCAARLRKRPPPVLLFQQFLGLTRLTARSALFASYAKIQDTSYETKVSDTPCRSPDIIARPQALASIKDKHLTQALTQRMADATRGAKPS